MSNATARFPRFPLPLPTEPSAAPLTTPLCGDFRSPLYTPY
jgi:hypothetical protein